MTLCLAQKNEATGVDFALVRLDRTIPNHLPLVLDLDGGVKKGTVVYVLGYPLGLPLKLADGALVSSVLDAGYFVANLDTFGGNSGSPVFNASTNQVEGILVRGGADFRAVGSCNRAFVCPEMPDSTVSCGGEASTSINQLNDSLKAMSTNKTVPSLEPITRMYRSGERLSGSGKNFSAEYELTSAPPRAGYKIGSYTYSLAGDRGCNAWSTCRASVQGDRVGFRFSLQGHDEWRPPGQAKSEGFLTVTFVPQQT
jgi:hypothetical protein